MIGIAVSKYVVKKGTVGLIDYLICFHITPLTGMCKQQRTNTSNFWLANHPLPFKVTSYCENITSAKSTSDIFKSENYHFSVGEPSANVGEPSASVGEPSASVGEPSPVLANLPPVLANLPPVLANLPPVLAEPPPELAEPSPELAESSPELAE